MSEQPGHARNSETPAPDLPTLAVARENVKYSGALSSWSRLTARVRDGRVPRGAMYLQDLIFTLQKFWAERGCVIEQPVDVEVGAGTFHPATFLRVLGPEPWNAAFAQFSRRPTDGRYGENPNRAGAYYQFQVGLKPSPLDVQDLYLDSLRAIGLDPASHDIRFVEDDWESPTLGAWGLGWEVWCDGMEVTQFTYFQQAGGIDLLPVTAELTYGLERIAMYLQDVDNMFDLQVGQERHLRPDPPPVGGRVLDVPLRGARPADRVRALRHVRGASASACSSARPRAAGLRVLHEGVARVQLARRARRDQRDRAPALHRPRARDGAGVRRGVRRSRARSSASRCCRTQLRRRREGRVRRRGEAGVNAGALAAARAVVAARRGAAPCRLICCSRSAARRSRRRCSRARSPICRRSSRRRLARRAARRTTASRALGTPRRLAVIVKRLADRQPDLREEVVGPPVSRRVRAPTAR